MPAPATGGATPARGLSENGRERIRIGEAPPRSESVRTDWTQAAP